jgi:N-acetylglucosamine-6-phosphate deacetylase
MKSIINANIIHDGVILKNHHLLFDKKIITITQEQPTDIETIDAKGAYLSAGFIDIHIHGSAGADVMDATPQALETISKSILQTGTTSFLATTLTMSPKEIKDALLNIKLHKNSSKGAKILGIHLEGPFINPNKKGAQNPNHIQKANLKLIAPYLDEIKMITLAPEMDGAEAFIKYLQKHHPHIILSIGHSDASYTKTKESFEWGVSHATHLFNAMPPLHHREPGVVGAVLEAPISCEIIADNIHLHPSFYNLIHRLKKEQLILITDSMRAGCMQCGAYELGGQKVVVKHGEARLTDGTLAGSVLRLNEALRNFYQQSDISLPELIKTVTKTPAQKLGLKLGELKEDYPADMVLFDEEFRVLQSFIDGELVKV